MASRTGLTLSLAASGIGIVVLLAIAIGAGVTDGFDAALIALVRADAWNRLLSPLRFITELGSTWAVTILALLVVALGASVGSWRVGVLGGLTILLASIGNTLLKATIQRERPELLEAVIVEHGFSFPSGHAALAMVAYGIVAVMVARSSLPDGLRRAIVVACAITVFLVGVSRVWLGVHYPTDVIAGWAAGGVVVLLYAELSRPASTAPTVEAAVADRGAPRFDRPGPG